MLLACLPQASLAVVASVPVRAVPLPSEAEPAEADAGAGLVAVVTPLLAVEPGAPA